AYPRRKDKHLRGKANFGNLLGYSVATSLRAATDAVLRCKWRKGDPKKEQESLKFCVMIRVGFSSTDVTSNYVSFAIRERGLEQTDTEVSGDTFAMQSSETCCSSHEIKNCSSGCKVRQTPHHVMLCHFRPGANTRNKTVTPDLPRSLSRSPVLEPKTFSPPVHHLLSPMQAFVDQQRRPESGSDAPPTSAGFGLGHASRKQAQHRPDGEI
ncbi:hypothetical protein BaRGS_00023619, partial [Batillaria attramentaria]